MSHFIIDNPPKEKAAATNPTQNTAHTLGRVDSHEYLIFSKANKALAFKIRFLDIRYWLSSLLGLLCYHFNCLKQKLCSFNYCCCYEFKMLSKCKLNWVKISYSHNLRMKEKSWMWGFDYLANFLKVQLTKSFYPLIDSILSIPHCHHKGNPFKPKGLMPHIF